MWFGNLVTMKWWNDLWLNEAFATWMAYEIVESWRPDWRIWLDFAHRREQALSMDALASSHPIAPPIRSAEEAQENFDAITYTKGASVLRMLERFLGADAFREGIRLYIHRHAEASADAEDLWSALSEVSKEPVAKIVSPWTLQTGYPLVSVRRPDHKPVEFVQERFLSLPPRSKRADPTRWTIPMVVRIGEGRPGKSSTSSESRNFKRLFSKRRDSLPPKDSQFAWIHPNDGEAGFFRVDHGEVGHHELLAHLTELPATERIGLIGNQWALCQADRLPIDALLDLITALGTESDPDVLGTAEHVLAQLDRRLVRDAGSEVRTNFRAWVCSVFEGQLGGLGLMPRPGEDDRERLRRGQILSIVGGHGRSENVVREAERRCAQHVAEGTPLPGELAGPILRIAAHGGGAILHAALRNATLKAETPQARRIYLFALSAFTDPELVGASLDAGLDAELAPTPDRAQLIAELLANPDAARQTWNGLKRSWKKLEKQMPPILLARLAGATAYALPPSEAQGIAAFFERKPLVAGTRVLRQISEELRIAARFQLAARDGLARYLGSPRTVRPQSQTDVRRD
jgi:puromycin-sensitive aminopeptidase